MRLAFLGTGEFGAPALRALHSAGHEIRCVVSQPDRPAGRGRAIAPTPIRAAAESLGLPHRQAESVNTPEFADLLREVELGVVVAFGQKIGADLLAAPQLGLVNIHASLLPRHRGAAPYQHAILSGDERTGVTIFRLNEKWDAGEILGQVETPIGALETADELHDRLSPMGAELIVRVVEDLAAGRARPQVQNAEAATRAPKLSKADGWVDWSQPARMCVRRIHGLWSWPSATCVFVSRGGRSERVQLVRARVVGEEMGEHRLETGATGGGAAGQFLDDLSVQAGGGRVMLLEVKPAGGKLMSFEAYANGRRIAAGDRLERVEAS